MEYLIAIKIQFNYATTFWDDELTLVRIVFCISQEQ